MDWTVALNTVIFVGWPYAALVLLVAGFIHRYRGHGGEISSHPTQFLEPKGHFWAVTPLHYGLALVLLIHTLCLLLPGVVLSWNSATWRLYLLECVALSAGLTALTGILLGMNRRRGSRSLRRVTGWLDWVVMSLVTLQVATGVLISLLYPWGTAWLSAAGTPYLWSLISFQPEIDLVVAATLLIKIHIVNAFLLAGLIPYTKLSHILLFPIAYLWRKPLVFRWKERVPD